MAPRPIGPAYRIEKQSRVSVPDDPVNEEPRSHDTNFGATLRPLPGVFRARRFRHFIKQAEDRDGRFVNTDGIQAPGFCDNIKFTIDFYKY